jgi:NAD(P)H-flavin reductase
VVYSSRSLDEVIYRAEFERLATETNLSLYLTLTRVQPPGWTGFARRIDRDLLADVVFPPADAPQIYICGPTAFVETAANICVELGLQLALRYDIEMTKDGKKHEMDCKEDGTIVNFENEIAAKDLPKAVTDAVKAKYPNSMIKVVMEVIGVKNKKEALEEYEVIIDTADKKDLELTVSPDGKKIEEAK